MKNKEIVDKLQEVVDRAKQIQCVYTTLDVMESNLKKQHRNKSLDAYSYREIILDICNDLQTPFSEKYSMINVEKLSRLLLDDKSIDEKQNSLNDYADKLGIQDGDDYDDKTRQTRLAFNNVQKELYKYCSQLFDRIKEIVDDYFYVELQAMDDILY